MISHSSHVMTLANSIIGVGILAMPFCFQKCGIVLAVLLLILSNWITRICCHFLIKISLLTRRKSFEFLGFHAFGSSGKLLVELCIIGYLIGTCITYFVVIGDLGPQIVTKMFNLNEAHRHLRTLIMTIVTLLCILPLGMLKNVDSLATICTASIGFYVCLVIKIILESGTHIVAQDWTDKVIYWEPAGILQCLPIISMALSCQMQIFEVFSTINNQSLEKLNGIVRNATWICTCVYIAVGFFGYVAFCTQPFSGNILINLAPSFGSDVIKIGFVLSVAFSFPLVIFPCRASIYSLLYRKGQMDTSAFIPEARFKSITIFIVGFALCVALMIPSVELIIGLVGSTIGVAICVMFPAASFRKIILKNTTERNLAQIVLIGGFCLMILGTYANLNAIDEQSSGAHLNEPLDLKHSDFVIESKINNFEKQIINEMEKNPDVVIKSLEEQEKEKQDELNRLAMKQSPPPLPYAEEEHKDPPQPEEPKSLNVEKIKEEPREKPLEMPKAKIKPIEIDQVKDLKDTESLQQRQEKAEDEIFKKDIPSLSIDKEALKNSEVIAAEEQKLEKLKETQKEIEKTKQLFERTVDELKEELAKQNQETQNLVVEKINKMVEKVEEIERKVQAKETLSGAIETVVLDKKVNSQITNNTQQNSPPPEVLLENNKNYLKKVNEGQIGPEANNNLNQQNDISRVSESIVKQEGPNPEIPLEKERDVENKSLDFQKIPKTDQNKPSVKEFNALDLASPQPKAVIENTNLLPEKPKESLFKVENNQNIRAEEQEAHKGVYEPLSYKAGELIEQEKLKIAQRFPPPLALLLNASQAKLNAPLKPPQPENTKDLPNPQKDAQQNLKPVAYEKQSLTSNNNNKPNDDQTIHHQPEKAKSEKDFNKDKEKDNIEAIRRDLLQVNAKKLQELATTLTSQHKNDSLRFKRSLLDDPTALTSKDKPTPKESCLTEPKLDDLIAPGSSLGANLQKQTVGRHLKSVDNETN